MLDLKDFLPDCVYCQGGYHEPSTHVLSGEQVDRMLADFKAGKRPDKSPNWDRNY